MDNGLLLGLAVGAVVGALVAWVLASASAARRSETTVRQAAVEAARAGAMLDAERRVARERLADSDRQADQFRALAAEALATSTDQFLALAHQQFAADHQTQSGELAQREAAVRAMVEPLSSTLDAVRAQLSSAEQARASGQAALGEQVRAMHAASEHLRDETSKLVTALRSSHVRGRWGEVQLRRVVEAAGHARARGLRRAGAGAYRRRACSGRTW